MEHNKLEISQLADMKIHDIVKIQDGAQALRVPGGWIYYAQTGVGSELAQTFVPEPLRYGYDRRIPEGRIVDKVSEGLEKACNLLAWSFGILAALLILLK